MLAQLATKSVLLVGAGGLGCPAAIALVRAGVGRLVVCDDDVVDETNLHRQLLYAESDVGRPKLVVAVAALKRQAHRAQSPTQIVGIEQRLLPENALERVRDVDVVIEGADNFATKFMAADVCHLARRPLVHSAALRWAATVWSVAPSGSPCYRCLFEDIPPGPQASCEGAGVLGPLVGVAGALAADHAIMILLDRARYGVVHSFDGKTDRLHSSPVNPRLGCTLCGPNRTIFDIERARYRAELDARTACG